MNQWNCKEWMNQKMNEWILSKKLNESIDEHLMFFNFIVILNVFWTFLIFFRSAEKINECIVKRNTRRNEDLL